MQGVLKKAMTAVLTAVLLFWLAFPVTGFQKPEKAYGNPLVAAPVIFGTIAAAYGICVAGASMSMYEANLNSLYSGFGTSGGSWWSQTWSEYVSAQGSMDAAMQSFVTSDGNISLQQVSDSGMFDSLRSYSVYCVDNDIGALGLDNTVGRTGALYFGNVPAPTATAPQDALEHASAALSNAGRSGTWCAFRHDSSTSTKYEYWYLYFADENLTWMVAANGTKVMKYESDWQSYVQVTYTKSTGNYFSTGAPTNWNGQCVISASAEKDVYWLNKDFAWKGYDGLEISNGYSQSNSVVVNPATYNGTATAPTNTVQPFTPTAEQLLNGFDSSAVVDAINSGNAQTGAGIDSIISTLTGTIGGVLNDIKTGVNGLETAVGSAISTGAATVVSGVSGAISAGVSTLGTVLNDIKTASQAIETTLGGTIANTLTGVGTTLGDIWGDLQGWYTDWLAWVGSTPLGALIAQVIAALQAGVLDLAGLLELVNAGILDMAAAIQLVIEAVNEGAVDIVGAIEGITFPSFELPKVEGTPQVAIPPADLNSSMDAVLQDKAPFAYMYEFGEGINSLEYSSQPKFRIRQTFDYVLDEIEIDINAEPWLNLDVGGVTIAQLLRASVTLTLCMGLLYGAYRTAMAAVKAG